MSHGATISRKWRLKAGPAPTGQTQLEPSLVGKARVRAPGGPAPLGREGGGKLLTPGGSDSQIEARRFEEAEVGGREKGASVWQVQEPIQIVDTTRHR